MFNSKPAAMMDAMVAAATSWGEIAAFSPLVVALRSEDFMAGLFAPGAGGGLESLRMVSEKIDAMTESAVEAATATGHAFGMAFLTGQASFQAPFDIANAATEPVRRRVRANVDRLSLNRQGD